MRSAARPSGAAAARHAADRKAGGGSGSSMANKELVVRCEGPIVSALQAVFVADWSGEVQQISDNRLGAGLERYEIR